MPNYNEENGIRFGVISPHAINPDALNDIYTNGTDPHYESGHREITDQVDHFLENLGFLPAEQRIAIRDEILDTWNNQYESCGDGQMDYSDKEYTLHVSGDNFGIFVMKSPYYTFCRGCSPCAPGAGDLNNPITDNDQIVDCMSLKTVFSAGKALCLGPEWFGTTADGRKIPYRVFRVENDQEVILYTCPECHKMVSPENVDNFSDEPDMYICPHCDNRVKKIIFRE